MDQMDILAEHMIKLENVELELDDNVEELNWKFTEGGIPYSVKSELKEEDGEEEEIKPPFSVFLYPEGVPNAVINQELEQDPLEMSNDSLVGESKFAVGAEQDREGTSSDLHIQMENAIGKCNKSNDRTLMSRGVKPNECAAGVKNLTEIFSLSLQPSIAWHVDASVESLSESGSEMRFIRKEGSCHECSICQKLFEEGAKLVIHVQSRSGERPYECTVCQKGFVGKSSLVRHMRIHSGERPHNCSVCQKAFVRKGDLVMHMRIHSDERPHNCSVCQKAFVRKCDLVMHMRIHSGERPYNCSICQKSFVRKGALVRHMRNHSGERPHGCSICQKGFMGKSNLVMHMRIHSDERPHNCPVCQKAFVRKCDLVRHMRIHSGERPYECVICLKTYKQKSQLVAHMRTHSEEQLH